MAIQLQRGAGDALTQIILEGNRTNAAAASRRNAVFQAQSVNTLNARKVNIAETAQIQGQINKLYDTQRDQQQRAITNDQNQQRINLERARLAAKTAAGAGGTPMSASARASLLRAQAAMHENLIEATEANRINKTKNDRAVSLGGEAIYEINDTAPLKQNIDYISGQLGMKPFFETGFSTNGGFGGPPQTTGGSAGAVGSGGQVDIASTNITGPDGILPDVAQPLEGGIYSGATPSTYPTVGDSGDLGYPVEPQILGPERFVNSGVGDQFGLPQAGVESSIAALAGTDAALFPGYGRPDAQGFRGPSEEGIDSSFLGLNDNRLNADQSSYFGVNDDPLSSFQRNSPIDEYDRGGATGAVVLGNDGAQVYTDSPAVKRAAEFPNGGDAVQTPRVQNPSAVSIDNARPASLTNPSLTSVGEQRAIPVFVPDAQTMEQATMNDVLNAPLLAKAMADEELAHKETDPYLKNLLSKNALKSRTKYAEQAANNERSKSRLMLKAEEDREDFIAARTLENKLNTEDRAATRDSFKFGRERDNDAEVLKEGRVYASELLDAKDQKTAKLLSEQRDLTKEELVTLQAVNAKLLLAKNKRDDQLLADSNKLDASKEKTAAELEAERHLEKITREDEALLVTLGNKIFETVERNEQINYDRGQDKSKAEIAAEALLIEERDKIFAIVEKNEQINYDRAKDTLAEEHVTSRDKIDDAFREKTDKFKVDQAKLASLELQVSKATADEKEKFQRQVDAQAVVVAANDKVVSLAEKIRDNGIEDDKIKEGKAQQKLDNEFTVASEKRAEAANLRAKEAGERDERRVQLEEARFEQSKKDAIAKAKAAKKKAMGQVPLDLAKAHTRFETLMDEVKANRLEVKPDGTLWRTRDLNGEVMDTPRPIEIQEGANYLTLPEFFRRFAFYGAYDAVTEYNKYDTNRIEHLSGETGPTAGTLQWNPSAYAQDDIDAADGPRNTARKAKGK